MSVSNLATMPTASALSPLQDVQNNFALLDLAGVFYILSRAQIDRLLHGQGYFSLSYYKEKEGKLVIRRHLEAQAHGLDDKEVPYLLFDFMKSTNPNVYNAVAFDPRPQPPP